jgi:hypothetical protein
MGYTRVRAGDTVIGAGVSPTTGKRISNKRGYVTDVRDHLGNDIVCVEWEDGSTDEVRQENVSGTQQGVFGRPPREEAEEEPQGKKRRWGRRG